MGWHFRDGRLTLQHWMATLGYFSLSGSTDPTLYGRRSTGSSNGKPDRSYDGFGRDASDNDALFLLAWFAW
jgi:hypothetical protein